MVADETAVAHEPAESAFYDPSMGEELEALGRVGAFDDLDLEFHLTSDETSHITRTGELWLQGGLWGVNMYSDDKTSTPPPKQLIQEGVTFMFTNNNFSGGNLTKRNIKMITEL